MPEITEPTTDLENEIFDHRPANTACNVFAWNYVEAHDNAVVKVGETDKRGVQAQMHCYVYDADKDLTIDATLSQFDGLEDAYWNGDEHPHCREWEEWTDKEAFTDKYDDPRSPFYC